MDIANQLSYPDFPKTSDILTIIRIESSFNPNARNLKSKGLMQVNYGSLNPRTNMRQGVEILREYYLILGSKDAARIAYNIGIGNYIHRIHMKSGKNYLAKFKKHNSYYLHFDSEE